MATNYHPKTLAAVTPICLDIMLFLFQKGVDEGCDVVSTCLYCFLANTESWVTLLTQRWLQENSPRTVYWFVELQTILHWGGAMNFLPGLLKITPTWLHSLSVSWLAFRRFHLRYPHASGLSDVSEMWAGTGHKLNQRHAWASPLASWLFGIVVAVVVVVVLLVVILNCDICTSGFE